MAFSVGQLQFLDSFQFMSESLDKLAANLNSEEMIYTHQEFTKDEQFELVQKKGIFPYDYFNNVERFKE